MLSDQVVSGNYITTVAICLSAAEINALLTSYRVTEKIAESNVSDVISTPYTVLET